MELWQRAVLVGWTTWMVVSMGAVFLFCYLSFRMDDPIAKLRYEEPLMRAWALLLAGMFSTFGLVVLETAMEARKEPKS